MMPWIIFSAKDFSNQLFTYSVINYEVVQGLDSQHYKVYFIIKSIYRQN
jgi:hypothetical protein